METLDEYVEKDRSDRQPRSIELGKPEIRLDEAYNLGSQPTKELTYPKELYEEEAHLKLYKMLDEYFFHPFIVVYQGSTMCKIIGRFDRIYLEEFAKQLYSNGVYGSVKVVYAPMRSMDPNKIIVSIDDIGKVDVEIDDRYGGTTTRFSISEKKDNLQLHPSESQSPDSNHP